LTIGVILNAVAVTIYTIPLQLTQRVAVVPSALTTALFPRLSASSEEHRQILGATATRVLCSIMTPPIVVAIFLIQPFLAIWVGPEMAIKAAPIGRILFVGFWANSLALVPFNQLQAKGRPDLVTKILIGEIPPYFAALFFGLREFGLLGCAIAQALRFIGDLLILSFVAKQKISDFRILALNFPFLLLAVFCAGQWSSLQWPWYATAIALAGVTAFLGWTTFPAEPRATILRSVQVGFAKIGLRFSA
jgi:O-antigen/teichoic acid export membrane protein